MPSPFAISSFSRTTNLDSFLNSLLDTVKHAINNSRLPFDRSTVPGKMAWWNKDLWSHRHRLRLAYKANTKTPSVENLANFKSLKSSYQRLLRQTKSDHWKVFCSTELNKDLFSGLKKLAAATNSCTGFPSSLVIDGELINDPSSISSSLQQ